MNIQPELYEIVSLAPSPKNEKQRVSYSNTRVLSQEEKDAKRGVERLLDENGSTVITQKAEGNKEEPTTSNLAVRPLKTLTNKHRNILYMHFAGQDNQQIADELGVKRSSIATVIRSPMFQIELRKIQEKAEEKLTNLDERFLNKAPVAQDKLFELMEHADTQRLQLDATKLILDYAGLKPVEKKEHTHTHELGVQEAWAKRRAGIKRDEITPAEKQEKQIKQASIEVESNPIETKDDAASLFAD